MNKNHSISSFLQNFFFPVGAFSLATLLWLFVISGNQYSMVLDIPIEARNLNSQKTYLEEVQKGLTNRFTDAFGGPDAAHDSFTSLQKAINYSMTAVLTTGGIRGKKQAVGTFQPRSFNLGISKTAFEKTQGFGAVCGFHQPTPPPTAPITSLNTPPGGF